MSDIYQVAVGFYIAPEDMVTILQQPQVDPVQPVERHYGVDGTLYDEGLYAVFHFDVIEDATLYQNILDQFGLLDNTTAEVTIYARSALLVWTQYFGIAHRPEPGVDAKWNRFFWTDINIYVTDLIPNAY